MIRSRSKVLALMLLGLVTAANCSAGRDVQVDPSRRYLRNASGVPVFLLGYYDWAAVAPGFYIDHPATYDEMIRKGAEHGINYIRITLGINCMRSSTDPPSWNGKPTPIAFKTIDGKADLDTWDPVFWKGLRYHCELARKNGMLAHICFFDGVGLRPGTQSYRWSNSPWNTENQTKVVFDNPDRNNNGYADENGDFYQVEAFRSNAGIGRYQRRLIDKALAETSAYDNVFYEIGNELLGSSVEWNAAVVDYVHSKTRKAVTQNEGARAPNIDGWAQHKAGDPLRVKLNAAEIVGKGCPAWEDPDGPALIKASSDDLRLAAWYSLVGGAAGWGGFTVDYWDGKFNAETISYYEHLQTFIRDSGVQYWTMTPSHNLVSNPAENCCLADLGKEYLLYIPNDRSITLDLGLVSGDAVYRLYDPRTGKWPSEGKVSGGSACSISKPHDLQDWVVYVSSRLPGTQKGH